MHISIWYAHTCAQMIKPQAATTICCFAAAPVRGSWYQGSCSPAVPRRSMQCSSDSTSVSSSSRSVLVATCSSLSPPCTYRPRACHQVSPFRQCNAGAAAVQQDTRARKLATCCRQSGAVCSRTMSARLSGEFCPDEARHGTFLQSALTTNLKDRNSCMPGPRHL